MSTFINHTVSNMAAFMQLNEQWEKDNKGKLIPSNYMKQVAENALAGAVYGAAWGTYEAVTRSGGYTFSWKDSVSTSSGAFNMACLVGSYAALSAVFSPLAYRAIKEINHASSALSRNLGYQKAIQLPLSLSAYIGQTLLTSLAAGQLGVNKFGEPFDVKVGLLESSTFGILIPYFSKFVIDKGIANPIK